MAGIALPGIMCQVMRFAVLVFENLILEESVDVAMEARGSDPVLQPFALTHIPFQ